MEQVRARLASIVWAIIVTVVVAFVYFAFRFGHEQFTQTYQGFGADVPSLTRSMLDNYMFLWRLCRFGLFSQVALLIAFLIRKESRVWKTFWLAAWLNGALALVIFVALYLPIFSLGSIV